MQTLFSAVLLRAPILVGTLLCIFSAFGQEGLRTTSAIPSDPPTFPSADYTPFGYIDNPYHSMVANRSGIVRSVPPLGFGWWRTDFEGEYGGANNSVDYLSFLVPAVRIGDHLFLRPGDFDGGLVSRYHSKHVVSLDWRDSSVSVRLRYFLPREHTLTCIVEFSNSGSSTVPITLYATHRLVIGDTRWWGSDGLVARTSEDGKALVSKIWAYGDVFTLGTMEKPSSVFCTASGKVWEDRIRDDDSVSVPFASVRGNGPLWATSVYHLSLAPDTRHSMLLCLSRSTTEAGALQELRAGLAGSLDTLSVQLADDQRFWSDCPVLEGDWPATWKHGWVYDYETVRMTVRRPLGIFRHPWDGMQIHAPRVVLGETCLDMMTLAYADPRLAKEVLAGTFEDARQPNVPCAREDGSVNMISSDGSECGTAPMWGYPFHVLQSIYRLTGDTAWVRKLYPRLKAYIDWWLAHRTDAEGWLHCNNSWESGQDGSKRFIVAEGNEGAVADFVRTVDVEASMAEAMEIMTEFAGISGYARDADQWRGLAARRRTNVRAMFSDGWFRDIDGRTGAPIILENPYDVAMLSPFACNVATTGQTDTVRGAFTEFLRRMAPWLQWPPGMQTFVEAAWNIGARMDAAEVVAATADRVYGRTDSRSVLFGNPDDPQSIRIPGVANEFWPIDNVRPGGEAYGWGATLPMHIIRAIVGFRERTSPPDADFYLSPTLPEKLMSPGKSYTVKNLRFRTMQFDVTYRCADSGGLRIDIQYRFSTPSILSVRAPMRPDVSAKTGRSRSGTLSFDGKNGATYVVRVDR